MSEDVQIEALLGRIELLEREREALLSDSRSVAAANARAALQMAERNLELERQGRELTEALERAEKASAKKDEFLAKVSHELRTPMNGVLGMTRFLLETDLTETQREFASTVLESADLLLVIINDLLDLSRQVAGKLELDEAPFDLWSMVEDVMRLLAPQAHVKGLHTELIVDSSVPRFVEGDAGRLRQILVNLLGNAVKFTDTGRVGIRVSCAGEGGQVCFKVEDSGPGIPNAAIARIFEPFEQLDNSTARCHGGTGLGLPICRGLATAMGGGIDVSSQVNRGSTFSLQVPLRADAFPPDGAGEPAFSECLLLVWDPGSLAILEDHLDALGLPGHNHRSLDELLLSARGRSGSGELLLIVEHASLKTEELPKLLQATHSHPLPVEMVLLLPLMQGVDVGLAAPTILRTPLRATELHALIRGQMGSASGGRKGWSSMANVPDLDGLSVLLVEDNLVNQRVASRMLERFHCRVSLAENGASCLRLVKDNAPDIVLMDCQMPVMDGYEATRRIRALTGLQKDLPVIALTANASSSDRARCLEAGMNDHLTKPLDPEALAQTLLRWRRRGA